MSDDPVLTTTAIDNKAVGIEKSLAKLVAIKIKKKAIVTPTPEAEKEEETVPESQSASQDKSEAAGHDEL
ncbi:hypothetical protein GGI21_006082 [Coemansia aciculifera]|nr:hypothetical protein GGI21_006082 [Coemansia aciculifera]